MRWSKPSARRKDPFARLKIPFTKSTGGEPSPAPLFAALVLVALVPAVGVLWFMSVAMRNERLAVQERLAAVYSNHLASLQSRVTAFVRERQSALQNSGSRSPSEAFAAIIRANFADGVVVYDGMGKVLYPAAAIVETPAGGNSGAARTLQAQAAELLKSGKSEQALAKLAELVGDARLRNAVGAQGALIVPNAQLLILKLLNNEVGTALRAVRDDDDGRLGEASLPHDIAQRTRDDLVRRLNDYTDADLPSSQRRFLMHEVGALVPAASGRSLLAGDSVATSPASRLRPNTAFPTLAAEDLAADYLEHDPAPATAEAKPAAAGKLQRTPLARLWSLPSADGTIVALFREERLRGELTAALGALALPDIRVSVLAPSESFAGNKSIAPQDAGEFLPGWRLALSFTGDDPLAAASARQTRFYLWTGFAVVVIIALVAMLVARYVAAQMRLARLKNELVSTVSHELKTPLASMRALVDTLLAGRYRDEQQLRDYLDLIAKENVRLSHLIENFLTFSRLERGKQPFRFEALDPASVMAGAVAALREKLGTARCAFAQQVDPSLPEIRGDAGALSTALINLLDNAYKYTNTEKRISARAYAQGRHVCFEVTDNGIGFERSEARKIFDRFYQVDQSLTRQRGGCGLGLGIVQQIVRAHGGHVEAESEPGKGSTFRVMIPIEPGHVSQRAQSSEREHGERAVAP